MGSVTLGLLMLLLGLVTAQAAIGRFSQWSAYDPALRACWVILAAAGALLALAGVLLLVTRGRLRLPLWTGGLAAGAIGATTIIGVLANVIPCSGPA